MSFSSSSTSRILSRGLSVIFLRRAELDPESTSLFLSGFDPDSSSHALQGSIHDRQSDARPGVVRIEPFEKPEQTFMISGGDADSIVFDPDPFHAIPPLGVDPNLRRGHLGNE